MFVGRIYLILGTRGMGNLSYWFTYTLYGKHLHCVQLHTDIDDYIENHLSIFSNVLYEMPNHLPILIHFVRFIV